MPLPFEESAFNIRIELRTIAQLSFTGAEDFKSAFDKTRVKELKWEFQKSVAVIKKKLTKI